MELKVPEWSIVFIALVAGLTLFFNLYQTPTYEATVKMLVSQEAEWWPLRPYDGGGLQETALTAARVVRSESVARATIEQLKLPELGAQEVLANTNVKQDPGTMFVNVSYRDSDPQKAQLIANTIAEVGSQKIASENAMPGANSIVARVWKPATLPEYPVSPKPLQNTISALVLALIVGVGWAFAWPYVKRRLSSS